MKQKFLLFFLVTFSFVWINAQDEESLDGEFYLSPDFGLMLGSINRIEFSPALGYYITDRLNIAGGFKYEFYSETKYYNSQETVKTHIFGPRVFARYTVFNNLEDFLPIGINTGLFAHTEFELSSLENKYFDHSRISETGRFWHPAFLAGGGFSQQASERIQINIVVLWDTSGGSISLYSNPIIRFGFQFFLRPKREVSF